MALEEFENDRLSDRDKSIIRMRSISNYVMGALLIAAGCALFFPTGRLEEMLYKKYDASLLKMFGIVCWIYGIFRLYRGYKKNYFRGS